jgi:hypothetical protein
VLDRRLPREYIVPGASLKLNDPISEDLCFLNTKYICKYLIMATAAVQHAPGNTLDQVVEPLVQENNKPAKHDVATELFYYDDPGDGTPPAPSYVG